MLDIVKGYKIPFVQRPTQTYHPQTQPTDPIDDLLISTEISHFPLEKGAIEEVDMSQLHYSNSLFLVAKRSGGKRPVINLPPLNRIVPNQNFRMESILLLKDILKPNSFLTKIDLKDAFYSIPIAKMSRKYLQFIYHNKLYQFCILPFGISTAPRVFSKILKPVIALLRTRGISLIIYLDDLLIATGTYIDCLNHMKQVISLLESLGFQTNYKKSIVIPKARILGLHNRFNLYVSRSPSRENPVNKIVSPKASENKRNHFNKTALKIHRPLHFSKIRCSPSTSTLPITSVSEKLCFKGSLILPHSVQSRGSPEPRSHNRPKVAGRPPAVSQQNTNSYKRPRSHHHIRCPKVVGRPPAVSQQNTNSYKQPRSHHHIRCLRSGLGSMVREKISSRPMVSGRNVLAYKPKGTSSCIFGSKNILPISNKSVVPHSASNRQSGSCFIYKSSGGNTLKKLLCCEKVWICEIGPYQDRSISLQGISQVSSTNMQIICQEG